jgi:hypothetical protein
MEETYKFFSPSYNIVAIQGDSTVLDSLYPVQNFRSYTHSFYAQDEYLPNVHLAMSGGIRAEYWTSAGTSQFSIQPRYNIRYAFNEHSSLKASYSLIYQYLHLLSSNGIGLPNDIWVPATTKVPPAYSHQYVIGAYQDIGADLHLSLEAYYKTLHQIIDYKDGTSSAPSSTDWQDKIAVGKGRAYGLELFVHKPEGKWNGWMSYTLAWNTRQIPNINQGEPYPFRYDRRHNYSLYLSRELAKPNRSISATWMFVSGAKTSLPTEIYNIPGQFNMFQTYPDNLFASGMQGGYVAAYGDGRNNFELRPFHKLDISYQASKKKLKSTRTWTYGIYNLYGRKNPYYLYLQRTFLPPHNASTWVSRIMEYSFMMWIPSVSYGLSF